MKSKNTSARGKKIIVIVLCSVDTSNEKNRVGNTHVKIKNCVQVVQYFHKEYIKRKYRKFEL